MMWFLFVFLGLAIGVVLGRRAAGKKVGPKKAAVAGGLAVVIGVVLVLVLGIFRGTSLMRMWSDQHMQYFGNEATGDVNGDGQADKAFLFTQSPGGSGTFYYVTVALAKGNGWVGTNAVLLGDRIAPQSTEIKDGIITVNYADRKPTDPFTTAPSVGFSKYFAVHGTVLSETPAPGGGVVCTMEAKLCPDGSYVGRSGPRCEFTPCPSR